MRQQSVKILVESKNTLEKLLNRSCVETVKKKLIFKPTGLEF